MNEIERLKQRMDQLDKERLRIRNDINKRQGNLRHYIAEMPARVRELEKKKIEELNEVLEDVELDLNAVLEQLFNAADIDVLKEGDGLMALLTYEPAEPKPEHRDPAQYRAEIEADLAKYKAHAEELRAQLADLDALIEATELELDEIIAANCPAGEIE